MSLSLTLSSLSLCLTLSLSLSLSLSCLGVILYAAEAATQVALDAIQCLGQLQCLFYTVMHVTCHATCKCMLHACCYMHVVTCTCTVYRCHAHVACLCACTSMWEVACTKEVRVWYERESHIIINYSKLEEDLKDVT